MVGAGIKDASDNGFKIEFNTRFWGWSSRLSIHTAQKSRFICKNPNLID
jgi:hypothetical protein